MRYQVKIVKDPESNWFVAEVPVLGGCMSQGTTIEEALENVKDAIQTYLEVLGL